MKIGLDEIKDSQYGMPEKHMEAMQKAAVKLGPIGIRPVSKFAKAYIEAGNPTKPFAVKNKSSNTGIAAGLIAIDPTYGRLNTLSDNEQHLSEDERQERLDELFAESKLKHDKDLKKVEESNKLPDEKIKEEKLIPMNLQITSSRIQELLTLDPTMKVEALTNSPYELKITWGNNDSHREAYAKAVDGSNFDIYDKDNEHIEVLGQVVKDEITEKLTLMAITADYDPLVFCPAYTDLALAHVDSPFHTQGLSVEKAQENEDAVKNPNSRARAESVTGGNWSPGIKNSVAKINEIIASLDPQRKNKTLYTMHHNAEFNNPFADDLKNNVPCFFALPKPMDLSSIYQSKESNAEKINNAKKASFVLIETPAEINLLRNVLRDQGYYWPSHARYVDTIQPFRPEVMALMQAAREQTAEREAVKKAASNSSTLIFQTIGVPKQEALKEPMKNIYKMDREIDAKPQYGIIAADAPPAPPIPSALLRH